jgi:hypothetical protein
MQPHPLTKYQDQINSLAQNHGISYLALFGSYARGEENIGSDVDLLVRYNKRVGLFDHAASQLAIEKLLNKPVDLVSFNSLDPMLRPNIMKDLRVIYDQRSSHLS